MIVAKYLARQTRLNGDEEAITALIEDLAIDPRRCHRRDHADPAEVARYPEVEAALWGAVQRVMVDDFGVDEDRRLMSEQIKQIVDAD